MKITVLCVGKIKEKYWQDAVLEYSKRLSRYCRLEIAECADERTPDKAAEALEDQIREKEAERLYKRLEETAHVIALEIGGEKYDSPGFSKKLENLGIQGKSHITFIIGGSLGLHKSILDRSDESLSFSDMTFPHQMMRVILLEQIYRGFKISRGEPYHK